MHDFWQLLLTDYTLQVITLGTAILGALCGMLGSFAVLKKQSLLGDAVAHAALPGIALSFLIIGVKNSQMLLVGALISGLIGAFWMRGIVTKTRLKTDTALGLILSLFFGFGMLLLTFIQKLPNAQQSGLDKYLFGQAATLLKSDVQFLFVVFVAFVCLLLLFWKEFKIYTFDSAYTQTLGFHNKAIDTLLTSLIVVTIVLGLQSVGVILISAMLLAPAAAARQWTHRLENMVILSGVFGVFSAIIGTVLSTRFSGVPTGPVIVIIAAILVWFSFVFSPKRGLLFRQIRRYKNRKELQVFKTLDLMYRIALEHKTPHHPHHIQILNDFQGYSKSALKQLEDQKLIKIESQQWYLTKEGYQKAAKLFEK